MSDILITGAGGFVGGFIARHLAERGRAVRAVVRAAAGAPAGVDSLVVPDIARSNAWDGSIGNADTIIHCAALAHQIGGSPVSLDQFRLVNRDATLTLARAAAAAGVRRIVFLSSIGVNGAVTIDRPFRADDPPTPHSPYAIAKWEAEQGLARISAETGLEVVVIRPPLVIGPSPKGNLGRLAAAIRKGLPIPLGSVIENRRDLVSLDTLADLVLRAIDHPGAPGGVLLVSDGRPVSTREIIERLAADVGRPPRLIPVAPSVLGAGLRLLGRSALADQLLGDLELDIATTMARLDWRPKTGAAQ